MQKRRADGPQCVLFANPHSGRTRQWLAPALLECERQGIRVHSVHVQLDDDQVSAALETARAAGVRTALVMGGDGTVGGLLPHLIHSDWTLGIIPGGTANDTARALCIPMNVRGAVAAIAGGRSELVDVGMVGDIPFAQMATIGLNTEFAREVQHLRRFLGRLSYPVAALLVYRRRRPHRVAIVADGERSEYDAYEVAFVNAQVTGGPLQIEVPNASMVDSQLQVAILERLKPKAMLLDLPQVIMRRRLTGKVISSFPLCAGTIEAQEQLTITIDGEERAHTPAAVRIAPHTLRVLVPADFDAPAV